jgi:hypothetical protein
VDDFEEGAKISDIVNHPSVDIKYQSVRRIIINKLGNEKYKEIMSGRGESFFHPTKETAQEIKKEESLDFPEIKTMAEVRGRLKKREETKTFWERLLNFFRKE